MESNNNSYDYKADFVKQLEEKRKGIEKPVILVCGYTGSGKTSILQAILGNVVSDDKIGHGSPMTSDYDKYENELVSVWDSKGLEPDSGENEFIDRTKDFLKEKCGKENEIADASNLINVFWYVIQGPGARVTDTDLKIIAEFPRKSAIVVISKNEFTKPKQLEALKKRLIDNNIYCIPENKIIPVSSDEYVEKGRGHGGIEELMELTRSIMPEAYQVAFDEAQKVNIERCIKVIEEKKLAATGIIAGAVAAAATAGAVPIPFSDALIIMPIQVGMIAGLVALYKLNGEAIQNAALPFLAKIAGMLAASSLTKLLPGFGSAISATVAGTLTGAMGGFVQNQFEKIAISKAKGEPLPPLVFDFAMFSEFLKNFKKNEK